MTDPSQPTGGPESPSSARPFINELKIKLTTSNNRVAGFVAGILEQVDRLFPGRALEEVERLRQEAADTAAAIALVTKEWQETAPLRDIRATHAVALATPEPEEPAVLDLSTPEGMTAHLRTTVDQDGHGLIHLVVAAEGLEGLEGLHAGDHRANQRTLSHAHFDPPAAGHAPTEDPQ